MDENDPVQTVLEGVFSFFRVDLDDAIGAANKNEKIEWDEMANWNTLGKIRDALDQLPEKGKVVEASSEPQPMVQSDSIKLFGFRDEPIVNGKKKKPLTKKRYDLVKRLIEAGGDGCPKTQLEVITSNYWKTLKDLKDADTDWDQVIHFPGKSHGGYWVS